MTESEACRADEGMVFELLKPAFGDGAAARLGRLAWKGRTSIETPNFFALTSRGVVPHITPDTASRHGNFGGRYMALEDFIERTLKDLNREPPILSTPATPTLKPLHAFTTTSPSSITVMGARRLPFVTAPMGNGNSSVTVFTSTGFQPLTVDEYTSAVETLRPDIAIPLADLPSGRPVTANSKRALRMVERTEQWTGELLAALDTDPDTAGSTGPQVSIFAPILPVPYHMQWEYLNSLSEEHVHGLSGLAIYDTDIIPDLRGYASLANLPRLSLDAPATPHEILRQIALGMDVFLAPFINRLSDAGIALTFKFPPAPVPAPSSPPGPTADANRESGTPLLPLGVDLSNPSYRTSLTPLAEGCGCYACAAHHRAYVHHLLSAREMLAWTLLQVHNHRVVGDFFAGVRAALTAAAAAATVGEGDAAGGGEHRNGDGAEAFGRACRLFAERYEPEFPEGMAQRPKARGYHFKSAAGEERRNPPAWGRLEGVGNGEEEEEDGAADGEAAVDEANGDREEYGGPADAIERLTVSDDVVRDMAETPVVPDEDSRELDEKGFAEIDKSKSG